MAKKIKVTRFNSVEAPDGSKGKTIVMIGCALILVLVGFVIGRNFASKSNAAVAIPKASAIAETHTEYGPFDRDTIVPSKFDHSTQGAVAAASTYIGFTPSFYLLKEKPFEKAIKQVASKQFESTLMDGMIKNRALSQSVVTDNGNAFYREIPLGYGLVSQSDDEVVLNVWSITMLAAQPDYNGNTLSKVHTIKMVWEDGDWKIDNWANAPGPTPRWQTESDVLSVDDFLKQIEPFKGGYDYAPSF